MMFSLQAAALVVPGFIRVGGLRLPVYGLFAAAGLIAALSLSQRTALRVGLSANNLWDAGVFAVIAAFVASRALLVVFDLRAFLRFPLLVLALPSLTYGGMLLTAVMVWGWLRWKRMPVLDALDAWAPCAALLAAVLSVAHFVEGTDAGMPTTLPWGVVTPGDTVLGRVHPVQIYAAITAIALCVVLLQMLSKRKFAGKVFALGLIVGGTLSFLLDMLRQPVDTFGGGPVEPGQVVALLAMLLGACIWIYCSTAKLRPASKLSRADVAKILEDFVSGRGGAWDWDEYISTERFDDPRLAKIQAHCTVLSDEFPVGPNGSGWCNEQGLVVILKYAKELRSDGEQSTKELV